MAYCRACGKEIPSGSSFCSFCGSPQSTAIPNQSVNTTAPPQKKGKVNGCLIAVLIVFLLPIIIATIFAVAWPIIDSDNASSTSNTHQDEEIKLKFSAECPLSVTNVNVKDNIIGYPEISGTFKNLSDKNISAIELYFVPKDVYGDERTNWMSTNYLVSDNMLYAGKKDTKTWSFIDQHVKNGDLYLYSVFFEDGTCWGDRDATKSTILKYGKKIDVSFEK